MSIEDQTIMALTADIVAAHVANNRVSVNDVPTLISGVYGALAGLGSPSEATPDAPKGAVSIRASIKHDYLVSMIDGKPYKMLKRHLSLNGYTPESYRQAFNLPRDYPMTAASYAAQRSELAHKIGLGRKPKAVEAPVEAAKPAPKAGKAKQAAEV